MLGLMKSGQLWRNMIDQSYSTGLGKQTLGGHKQNLVCTRRKEQWPHKRLSQTCLRVSRSLQQRHGLTVACRGVRGTEYNSRGTSSFEGVCHYPYHSLALGQTTGREHSPTHQQKIGWKTYWVWLHPSEQTQIPPQPVPPIRNLPQASYPYSGEGRQNGNHSYRKLTNLVTCFTVLSNSMKLWAMPCRAT